MTDLSDFFESIERDYIQNTVAKYRFFAKVQDWPVSVKERKKAAKFREFLKEVISEYECAYGDKNADLIPIPDSSDN